MMNEKKNLKIDYLFERIITNINSTNDYSKELITTYNDKNTNSDISETMKINDYDNLVEFNYKDFKDIYEINDSDTEEFIPKNIIYLENQLFTNN